MNSNSSSSSSSSSSSRLQEYLSNIPFATLSLLIFNVFIHIFMFITDYEIGPFTFFPYNVLYYGEWYRIFTSAFLHGGLMHIGMNMMSLIALGGALEPGYGTTRFYYFTLLSIVLEGIYYVTFTYLCAKISGDVSYLYSNSIGYSGVLFSYAVIEAFHSPVQSRSVFGCFNVPTKSYPFVLLVILQIMLPNISFFGHLAGLLAGVTMMTGFGDKLLMPSLGCFDWIDSRLCLSRVRRLSSFKLMTTKDLVHPYFEARDCGRAISHGFGIVWWVVSSISTLVWNIVMTIAGIIGIPTERCSAAASSLWISFKNCCVYPINAIQEYRRGTPSTTNDQGYESVALDSQHGEGTDVENGGVAMVGNPMTANQKESSFKGGTIARPPQTIGGSTAPVGNNRVYTRDLNAKFLERFTKNANGNETGSSKVSSSTKAPKTTPAAAANKKPNPSSGNSPKTLNI